MAERASVTQGVYLAVETTPGDGTTPNRIVNSFSIEPGVKVDMQKFRPTGQKVNSIIVPGKEWVEASVKGLAEYSELHFLLSAMFGKNQVTQPSVVAGTAEKWMWLLNARDLDVVKTFSFVQGDSNFAESFNYGLMTELGLNMSRTGIEIEGTMIAHELETGATLPHPVTAVDEAPLLPTDVSVYLSDTYASIGSSKLTRALMCNEKIGDRHNPVWVLDAAEPSFVTHVETAPSITWELTVEANDDGMDLLDSMRVGDTLFLRTDAVSGALEANPGTPYSYRSDAATKIADVDKFSDEDGVYAIKYTLEAVYDSFTDLTVEKQLVNKSSGY
jgi:hypothetical protein